MLTSVLPQLRTGPTLDLQSMTFGALNTIYHLKPPHSSIASLPIPSALGVSLFRSPFHLNKTLAMSIESTIVKIFRFDSLSPDSNNCFLLAEAPICPTLYPSGESSLRTNLGIESLEFFSLPDGFALFSRTNSILVFYNLQENNKLKYTQFSGISSCSFDSISNTLFIIKNHSIFSVSIQHLNSSINISLNLIDSVPQNHKGLKKNLLAMNKERFVLSSTNRLGNGQHLLVSHSDQDHLVPIPVSQFLRILHLKSQRNIDPFNQDQLDIQPLLFHAILNSGSWWIAVLFSFVSPNGQVSDLSNKIQRDEGITDNTYFLFVNKLGTPRSDLLPFTNIIHSISSLKDQLWVTTDSSILLNIQSFQIPTLKQFGIESSPPFVGIPPPIRTPPFGSTAVDMTGIDESSSTLLNYKKRIFRALKLYLSGRKDESLYWLRPLFPIQIDHPFDHQDPLSEELEEQNKNEQDETMQDAAKLTSSRGHSLHTHSRKLRKDILLNAAIILVSKFLLDLSPDTDPRWAESSDVEEPGSNISTLTTPGSSSMSLLSQTSSSINFLSTRKSTIGTLGSLSSSSTLGSSAHVNSSFLSVSSFISEQLDGKYEKHRGFINMIVDEEIWPRLFSQTKISLMTNHCTIVACRCTYSFEDFTSSSFSSLVSSIFNISTPLDLSWIINQISSVPESLWQNIPQWPTIFKTFFIQLQTLISSSLSDSISSWKYVAKNTNSFSFFILSLINISLTESKKLFRNTSLPLRWPFVDIIGGESYDYFIPEPLLNICDLGFDILSKIPINTFDSSTKAYENVGQILSNLITFLGTTVEILLNHIVTHFPNDSSLAANPNDPIISSFLNVRSKYLELFFSMSKKLENLAPEIFQGAKFSVFEKYTSKPDINFDSTSHSGPATVDSGSNTGSQSGSGSQSRLSKTNTIIDALGHPVEIGQSHVFSHPSELLSYYGKRLARQFFHFKLIVENSSFDEIDAGYVNDTSLISQGFLSFLFEHLLRKGDITSLFALGYNSLQLGQTLSRKNNDFLLAIHSIFNGNFSSSSQSLAKSLFLESDFDPFIWALGYQSTSLALPKHPFHQNLLEFSDTQYFGSPHPTLFFLIALKIHSIFLKGKSRICAPQGQSFSSSSDLLVSSTLKTTLESLLDTLTEVLDRVSAQIDQHKAQASGSSTGAEVSTQNQLSDIDPSVSPNILLWVTHVLKDLLSYLRNQISQKNLPLLRKNVNAWMFSSLSVIHQVRLFFMCRHYHTQPLSNFLPNISSSTPSPSTMGILSSFCQPIIGYILNQNEWSKVAQFAGIPNTILVRLVKISEIGKVLIALNPGSGDYGAFRYTLQQSDCPKIFPSIEKIIYDYFV